MSKVIVIGGGPAGMMAALAAAESGHEVLLLEKNEKLGKKLYITGKGRCNITNSGDMEDLFANVMTNSKFLYSAFYGYDNLMVMEFFEQEGLAIKNERGNRVFPVSDHSSDVINTLQRALKKAGVEVKLYTEVEKILFEDRPDADELDKKEAHQIVKGVQLKSGLVDGKKTVMADVVIVATGGFSYQATGSTGDGYRFAKEMGHIVTEIYPSLVPFNTKEEYVKEMQGLALKNVTVRIFDGKKKLYEDFGEMLFTHFGVSGPLLLSASAKISPKFTSKELQMEIDLKPALDEEQLDKRILKDFEEAKNKQFKNSIGKLFPAKMIPVILE